MSCSTMTIVSVRSRLAISAVMRERDRELELPALAVRESVRRHPLPAREADALEHRVGGSRLGRRWRPERTVRTRPRRKREGDVLAGGEHGEELVALVHPGEPAPRPLPRSKPRDV